MTIAISSARDIRQIGKARHLRLSEAGYANEETVRYLASLPACDRDSEIEKLLTRPVSVSTLRRQRKVSKANSQAVAQVSRSRDLIRDTDSLAAALDDCVTDEVKLAAICRRLASRAPLQGNFVSAVRLCADMLDALAERDLDEDARAIVAANKADLIEPDATADGDEDFDTTAWSALAGHDLKYFQGIDEAAYGAQRRLKED